MNDVSPDPITAGIGREISLARTALPMSQEALAAECNLSLEALQAIEEGTRRVSSGALLRIAETLGVEPQHFFRARSR